MEIRLNRSEFLGELIPMQGIVERKTTIPVLSHLLLTAREDTLHLAATDLDVSLTSRCDAEVKREGGVAVQAKKLVEIIRSLTAEEVLLTQDEPRELTIRAGRSRFKIHGLSPDDFPTLPGVDDSGRVEIPFADFRRMIAKILFAVSAEESRFQLNGALLKLKDGSVEMVATDGHRLALVEGRVEASSGDDSVLVPRKALQELQRLEGDGKIEYRRGEHHLSFRLGRRELICRILEGNFPDYERVIAKDNDKKILFERKSLSDAVQRVALLTGDRARAVRLQFTPEQMVISAANPDLGEAVEEVACDYDGPEFRVGINPDYLTQFLAAVDTDRIRLELKDENTQCVGYPHEGPDARYLCVIMPMRI
ncbi:MAG TPA: DNA polymerase III subunit beta [Thermoanaerobaculia bacterium]|jgi:DNA polymerase-3 subunit beta|nr:DNA polymerase III subunit beta [Thermoanaerobaculia bacterium]